MKHAAVLMLSQAVNFLLTLRIRRGDALLLYVVYLLQLRSQSAYTCATFTTYAQQAVAICCCNCLFVVAHLRFVVLISHFGSACCRSCGSKAAPTGARMPPLIVY